MNGAHPMLEVTQSRLRQLGIGGEPLHLLAQRLPGASKPTADRAVRDLEHLRQLRAAHALPVEQLEEDLEVERQSPQSTKQQRLLFVLDRELRARGIEVGDPTLLEVGARLRAVAPFPVAEDLPARHRKQKRPEAGVTTQSFPCFEAPHERLLDQVVDVATDLVAEEPIHGLEVPIEQRLPGVVIARPPGLEQRVVVVGCHPRRVYVVYHGCVRGWMVVALLGLGCGPTMGLPDPSVGSTGSNGAPQDAGGDAGDDGAGGAFDPEDGLSDDGGSTGSSGGDSSTGAPPFMDGDVIGVWLCTGDNPPFVMHVDDYMSPSDLSGSVCADWNAASDPLQWGPCANLSAHPIGGGAFLPVYAEVYDPLEGSFWTVSAGLIYDTASDSMEGTWLGPSNGEEPIAVSCLRLQ